jgi:hypothetical protein
MTAGSVGMIAKKLGRLHFILPGVHVLSELYWVLDEIEGYRAKMMFYEFRKGLAAKAHDLRESNSEKGLLSPATSAPLLHFLQSP